MKKTLLTLATLGMAVGAFGQGLVYFDNLSAASPYIQIENAQGGVISVAYALNDSGKNPGSAPWYVALLYNATSGGGIAQSVMNTDILATYEPNTSSGSGNDGTGTFEDYSGGTRVKVQAPNVGAATFEVVSWIGTATTWTAALAGGATYTGESPEFTLAAVATTGTPAPPAVPSVNGTGAWNGLLNMTPASVPEPTTIALGGLGAAALLLFRRKK